MKTAQQFDQDALPIFCDKGVFRILVDIYLQKKDQFQILIQMLMDFIQPIEESFWQAKVFGVNIANVVDTVLNEINFKWSFKGYLILAIEK